MESQFCKRHRGTLTTPTIGEFEDGRGEFYSQETFNGRAILVRFVISDITPDSCRFEQAFVGRRRQDLGSELDCCGHARKALVGEHAFP